MWRRAGGLSCRRHFVVSLYYICPCLTHYSFLSVFKTSLFFLVCLSFVHSFIHFLSLFVCLFICLCLSVSLFLFVCLFICLCLSVSFFICFFLHFCRCIFFSLFLSLSPTPPRPPSLSLFASSFLSFCLSVCVCLSLSLTVSVCLSVSFSQFRSLTDSSLTVSVSLYRCFVCGL